MCIRDRYIISAKKGWHPAKAKFDAKRAAKSLLSGICLLYTSGVSVVVVDGLHGVHHRLQCHRLGHSHRRQLGALGEMCIRDRYSGGGSRSSCAAGYAVSAGASGLRRQHVPLSLIHI